MRLIDAKVLKQAIMMQGLMIFNDLDFVDKAFKIVDRQDEVYAVPVDWIAKYLRTADDNTDQVIAEMMSKYYEGKNEQGNPAGS